ncbi:hypothetical protein GL325_06040 [Aeromicrobium sp. 636]|uniref:Uncharacterized protein n=1 Tax=Aeromicrobium senzhongii TaxID=2663859 RepID=A0A8I0EUJ1_9ACTN|nr:MULTISPECIES: hypothetical protein [Aeromicrobium]MBC9225873.1 hypothetical protein [Aeromicrobium senzhongii]MCQ3997980.1 hypothetical protein [Aeromicrobium sp. 636]
MDLLVRLSVLIVLLLGFSRLVQWLDARYAMDQERPEKSELLRWRSAFGVACSVFLI